ncbi:MAG: GTP-binding protein, partial [Firmicutes bacterium]|nr:GTP-binding protein [Bacillota bacterium]
LNVAIIGKPNVGKSSLMNALLKETRAIVTSIPGTTRDTIEEAVTIRNIPIKLTDTAGIRQTDDIIEKIGIEKSKESFNKADLVIFMVDNSKPLNAEDYEIMENIGSRKVIVIINKMDLDSQVQRAEVEARLPNAVLIEASIANEMGLDRIEEEVENLVYGGQVKQSDSMMVTNVRHKALLEEASQSLADAINMAQIGEALEFLEIDVNRAYEVLGQIIGEAVEEDIINEVFARFCLGK